MRERRSPIKSQHSSSLGSKFPTKLLTGLSPERAKVGVPPSFVECTTLNPPLIADFHGFWKGPLEYMETCETLDFEVLVGSKPAKGLADSAPCEDKVRATIGVGLTTDNVWNQVRKGDRFSTVVTYQQPLKDVPHVAMGFVKLDMGKHESALRLILHPQNVTKDTFICNAETWGETYLYNIRTNWIAISEPGWQTGVFKTKANNPTTLRDNRITFDSPFTSPPMIFVCFSGLDMSGHWDSQIYATNVDHTGFCISLITSPETKVGVARISWIAIPGEDAVNRKNAWIGRFSTTMGSAVQNGPGNWKGSVKFGFQFKAKPKVFMGVDQFRFSHERNMRLFVDTRNVSKAGMDWVIGKWGDSVLEVAGASFLALDCE